MSTYPHHITDPVHALGFMTAGEGHAFTIVSKRTHHRFTYRTVKANEKPHSVQWVSVLTGPDNETSYDYFGYIKYDRLTRRPLFILAESNKTRLSHDAPSVLAFLFAWQSIAADSHMPRTMEFWHQGRCCKCGRALTDPTSIASGIGPTCAKKGA